jgi:peptide/nickel transport system substrate-binding protein
MSSRQWFRHSTITRPTITRPTITLAALALGLGTLLAPGSAGAQGTEQPRPGGTLVIGIFGDPPIINPAASTQAAPIFISSQIFSTLVSLDNNYQPQPELAERWEFSPDGKTYTFYLRKNVKWHDGQPFTAADVKYSILEVSRKLNGFGSTGFAPVDTIDTPDDSTLVFHLKAPFPAFFPWSVSDPNFAQIIPKHLFEGTDPSAAPANFNPVGTGPFKFKEWVKGDHVTLERNPDYWKPGLPYLDRIVFKIIPDNAARMIALEKGELDYIPFFSLPASAVKQWQSTPGLSVVTTDRPPAGIIEMFFNLRNENLKVKEVRQAIAHALDRKALLEKAAEGVGKYPTSLLPSSLRELHTDSGRRYEFSPEKANALLDQAGFKRGPDGSRFRLRINFDRGQEGGSLMSAAEIMREQLSQAGIRLDITPLDTAAWSDTSFVKWDFDLTMSVFGTGPDPAVGAARLYISKNIQPLFGRNLMGYSNPQVDDLFARGESEIDPQKRVAIYHQIQEILNEDVPALPLWEKRYPMAFRSDFVGLPQGPQHQEAMDRVWWTRSDDPVKSNTALFAGGGGLLLLLLAGAFTWSRRATRRRADPSRPPARP